MGVEILSPESRLELEVYLKTCTEFPFTLPPIKQLSVMCYPLNTSRYIVYAANPAANLEFLKGRELPDPKPEDIEAMYKELEKEIEDKARYL